MTLKELLVFYLENFDLDQEVAGYLWLKDDVIDVNLDADGRKFFRPAWLTDEAVSDILNKVHENFDAEQGINWDNIRFWSDVVKQDLAQAESKEGR